VHRREPSGPLATILGMHDADLTALRVPSGLRDRAREILTITDDACTRHLHDEYGQLCRHLVARLARKRPSPVVRGDARIWAAGVIYAIGQVNFLFDPLPATAPERRSARRAPRCRQDDDGQQGGAHQ
jgi:Domain of unknown function (DUF6398)